MTFDGQHNQTHHDNYIAGTSFNGDSVIGENGNINNTYYFVGGPTAPHDSFEGGQGSGWNTAIFSDSRASYSIHANADNTDITNVGDPAHGGTLTIDGAVQALAFAPTMDPTPGSNGGVVHASGDELLILGNVNNSSRVTAFAVDGAATLEFAGAVSDVSVTFDSPGEPSKSISRRTLTRRSTGSERTSSTSSESLRSTRFRSGPLAAASPASR